MGRRSAILIAFLSVALPLQSQEAAKVDHETLASIREEGLRHSQVMEHIGWLADVYGPRLTGTPALRQASQWVMKRFQEWGLSNVHEEEWKFGKGWTLERFSAHLIEPQIQPLIGYPKSWTPGTNGRITAEVVYAPIASEADFGQYRGKLRGKIVLSQPARRVDMLEGGIVLRMTDAMIREAESTPIPESSPAGGPPTDQRLGSKITAFFYSEGVAAVLDRGADSAMVPGGSDLSWQAQRTDGGTIFVGSGGPRDQNAGAVPPAVTLAVEHYNRMVRLLEKNIPVRVELEVQAKFHEETGMNGFNTIAELPGGDLAQEIVLLGAHLDTTHAATGATDNACGVGAMMEALRILKVVGAKPRRTIRVGLWGGEEQGLLGSRAYVRQHLAERATMKLLPGHENLSVNFNLDNGTGKVRGIWLEGNLAAKPIFEQWLPLVEDLGVAVIGPRSVSSTDHTAFDEVGLPAFQFMVERLEYRSRTHHSNMDVLDRVQREDMVQEATVTAIFAYLAAMREEKFPRKPLPRPAPPK
jgi:carboxypeptidase Q